MIIVNFKKVIMENFCCYKDRMEYPFKNGNISLITGPNGIGKSTIFSAVPYTLYGVTPTGLKGDDVVNNEIGKNCYTAVEFDIDKDQYLCERYCKNSKLGNSAILTKNNIIIKKGHTEVIAEIERILMPQKLFLNTLLFGQKVKTFFTDLNDTDQKDIFRKVLLLDDYLLYYDESSKKLKSFKVDLEKTNNDINIILSLIGSCKNQITQLEKSELNFYDNKKIEINNVKRLQNDRLNLLEENKKSLLIYGNSDLDSIHSRLNDHLINLKNQHQNEKTNLNNINNQIKSLKNEKENVIKSDFSSLENTLTIGRNFKINEEKLSFQKESKELQANLSAYKATIDGVREKYKETGKDYNNLKNEINSLKQALSEDLVICQSCKQEVGKDNIIYLEEEAIQKQEKLKELETILENLKVNGNNIKNKISDIEEKLKKIEKNLSKNIEEIENEYNTKINKIKNDLKDSLKILYDKYQKKVTSVENKNKDLINELIVKISKAESEKDEIFKKIKDKNLILESIRGIEYFLENSKNLIDEKEKEKFDDSVIILNKLKLKELNNKHLQLEKDRIDLIELIDIYEFWKIGYSMSGIPSMLIDEAIPFMNEKIKFYLDQIGSRYIVAFDTLNKNKSGEFKDKIAVNIFDSVTKANSRKQLSGGQTRIVDIATILTLRDLQSNTQDMKSNIVILDEIFDSLDSKNIEYVSNLLRKMIKDNSVNIISHTQIDQLDADDVLRFC